ncbi:hypothetical protein [Vulcanisaeta souniana]|uniref:Uncharacterized protein n=1 Tax=Vulcanisaeta souniana JCM 11219 TaxID=1293586 RepID=A0A830E0Q6_9CREN|nr:hypothetical protein [Vulcanisaeta souniana]BDR92414.1 hypothetical protein Vsou_15070 [Vulcanisaeta souniana JCM 11219]GGI75408.1 hypothetical protein GCM10007112_10230 [Vulcanisaeta souniana JCM 11219]
MLKPGNRKRKLPSNEEIEEELVIEEEGKDEFGLNTQPPQPINAQSPMTRHQDLVDLRNYIDELSRRIEEVANIRNEMDKLIQIKPTIENYISTLNEVIKILTEINNLLNKLEELRKRL